MGNADELNEDFMTSQGSLADFVIILNQEEEGLSNKMFAIASPTTTDGSTIEMLKLQMDSLKQEVTMLM